MPVKRHAKQGYSARRARQELIVKLVAPPAVITGFLWVTSLNAVDVLQAVPAFFLLLIPWAAYLQWRRERRTLVPFFAIVAFMYWIFYAVPLFWGDRVRLGAGPVAFVTDSSITAAMWMALIGVLALWLGCSAGFGRRFAPKRVRDVPPEPKHWNYMRWLLIAGSVLNLMPDAAYVLGAEGRQVILAFEAFVPLVIFIILFRKLLQGVSTRFDRYAILIYLFAQFLLGTSSGWLGAWLSVVLACIVVWMVERGRIPIVPVVLMIAYVAFFQVGKEQYRATYWAASQGSIAGNPIDKINAWIQYSWQGWQQGIAAGNVGPQMLHASVMRASLLTQTANVIDYTPAYVPYQYGATYREAAVSLVPRLIWPDKPSANDANRFYQVTYGVTQAQSLSSVSISVGVLTEGYINFGWPGVFLIMFLLGMLFDFVSTTFLSPNSGVFYSALGIAILMQFIVIESQMDIYLGGLLQRVLVTLVVFVPATRWVLTRGSLDEITTLPLRRPRPAATRLGPHA